MTWKGTILVVLLFIIIGLVIFYPIAIFDLPPMSQHQWRQTDSLVFYYVYYYFNVPFLEPEILNQFLVAGKQVGDFPIHYFLAAKLSKLLGFYSEAIYRSIVVFYFFLCSLALYAISRFFNISSVLSVIISTSIYIFPILTYYGYSFLPEVPALSLTLWGIYFMLRYIQSQSFKYQILIVFLFSLASAIRITAIIPYLTFLIILLLIDYEKKKIDWSKILFILPLITLFCWISYHKSINSKSFYQAYLSSPQPIFSEFEVDEKEVLARFWREWIPAFLFRPLYLLFLAGFICIYFIKNKWVKRTFSIAILGYLLFFLLMFFFYYHHDYGLIPYTILFFACLLGIVYSLKNWFATRSLAIFFLLFLIVGVLRTRQFIHQERYHFSFQWDNDYEDYIGIDSYLDSIGITRTDKIISLGDESAGITLYFAKRKGFTAISHPKGESDSGIEHQINLGAKYFLVKSIEAKNYPILDSNRYPKIGQFKTIEVRKIQ